MTAKIPSKLSQNEKKKAVIFVVAIFILFSSIVVFGYQQYFKLLPALVGINNVPFSIAIIFGFFAGVVSFFAPCSIALLPSYISFFLGSKDEKASGSIRNSLKVGAIVTSGMLLFYIALGSIFLALAQFNTVTYFIRILVPAMAIILLILGISFVSGKSFNLPLTSKIASIGSAKERKFGNMFLFGMGYAGGSIACFLPIFILLIVTPFLLGNFVLGFFIFVSFALGKGLLMIFATILVGLSKGTMVHKLAISTDLMHRVGGVVIILVSIYLGYLSLVFFKIIPMLNLGGF